VIDAINSQDVVIVGMKGNGFVRKARNNLRTAGIPFKYLEFGGYFSMWSERLAIKMWSGFPTFPQIFVKGELIGGNSELESEMKDGTIYNRLGLPIPINDSNDENSKLK